MNAELNQLFESVIEIDIWASNDAEINNLVIGTFIGSRTVCINVTFHQDNRRKNKLNNNVSLGGPEILLLQTRTKHNQLQVQYFTSHIITILLFDFFIFSVQKRLKKAGILYLI